MTAALKPLFGTISQAQRYIAKTKNAHFSQWDTRPSAVKGVVILSGNVRVIIDEKNEIEQTTDLQTG